MRTRCSHRPSPIAVLAAIGDALGILAFVIAGRRSHEQDPGITGALITALPFWIGAAAGWMVARGWRAPAALRTGLIVWIATIVIGMILRNVVIGRGTATSFVLVATLVTGAVLVGWRAVALAIRRGS